MNKNQILNIIAWILIITGVILLIWKIFGSSPSGETILIALVTGLLFKVMIIGNDITKLKIGFKFLARDFKEHIKQKKH